METFDVNCDNCYWYREAKMYENAEEYYRVALKLNPKVLPHMQQFCSIVGHICSSCRVCFAVYLDQ